MNAKTKTKLLNAYREHLLENGTPPATVYRFCKDQGVKESDFYKEFSSFEQLEAAIWADFVGEARRALEASEDYAEQGARQLLLSFYFTFFEVLRDHRSFFLLRWPGLRSCGRGRLGRMKSTFREFAGEVTARGESSGEIASRGKPGEWFPRLSEVHLLFLLEFHAKDDSAQFERTDALIEKSVRLLFDAAREQVIDSAFDLVRFLVGKTHG